MDEELEISVIIPTRNRANLLDGALDSLVRQTLDPRLFEIIVVDDGSTDHTAELVDAYRVTRLYPLIVRSENLGRGVNAGRNTGLTRSTAAIACFLDDDEMAPADHLERIVTHLDGAPEIPGIGGPAVDARDSTIRTCRTCDLGSAALPVSGIGGARRLLGGNMVIRRRVFDEVGGFDPELSGRDDETEWFQRASRSFLYDESLFVWHRRGPFDLKQLVRLQFQQGKSIPVAARTRGDRWRPSPVRFVRYAGHAVFRGCGKGVLLAARELGASTTWLTNRARSPFLE